MDTPTLEATEVHFTESAAVKVATLLAEENNPKLNLRVYVRGGGCHGLEYGFIFDEIQEDDIISEYKLSDGTGIKLLVDPFSYQYLTGAEIHYDDENIEARFIIRGLKAKTTCGCGSSFSVDDD